MIKHIDHLGIAVSDLDAAITIYKDVLGLELRGTEEVEDDLKPVADRAQEIKQALVTAVDADTNAFNSYMAARRLPENTVEEKEIKQKALQDGLKEAVLVPLETANLSAEVIGLAETAAKKGNINSVTDAGVGAQVAFTGVKGGILNVLINLKEIDDDDFITDMQSKCGQIEADARQHLDLVMKLVDDKIDQLLKKRK